MRSAQASYVPVRIRSSSGRPALTGTEGVDPRLKVPPILLDVGDDTSRQVLAWIFRINFAPNCATQHPDAAKHKANQCSETHDQFPLRADLPFRVVRRVKYFDRGNFLRLLNLGHFVLLGQGFVYGLLDLGAPKQIAVSN